MSKLAGGVGEGCAEEGQGGEAYLDRLDPVGRPTILWLLRG
jgi:hypothetical protein